jgi:hypothetical protein
MSSLLQEIEAQIAGVKTSVGKQNVGTVREISDGVAKIEGLTDAMLNEMLDFGNGITGLALNLEETEVGAIILGDYLGVHEGQEVKTTGKLLSGSYAEVHLKLPGLASTHLLPVNTLLFRSEGLQVAVVKDNKVVLTQVMPGHDFGDQIEILSGLKGDESVIQNPSDSILSGQQVQIAQVAPPSNAGAGQ